ncbi:hypothetical protein PIB30_111084, partial [Stylosanthes scabra]|nr:hypothetical protein [Stylosanthes scabra]
PQPQPQPRPILMMPTPCLPESAPPSFRPKQIIFRPPTCALDMPNPAGSSTDALSAETVAASAGRTSSRLLKHAAGQNSDPPKKN